MLIPNLEKIPQELKVRPQWVLWRQEVRAGKPTKVPYQPRYPKRKASITNPDTWGTLEQALSVAKTKGFGGIGYVFSPQDDYAGIDLDKCRDPITGKIESWAKEIITRCNSYTEISPSGSGVHIIIKGKLPPDASHKKNLPETGKIEVYDRLRYFTMTGHHLEGIPTTIESREKELKAFNGEVMARPKTPPKPPGPSQSLNIFDSDILTKARSARNGGKFSQLERGNWQGTGYPSQSEADIAFCSMLAFYTQNPDQIDRLFRASALYREKWNRPTAGSTYGAKTIEKALAGVTGIYQGTRKQALNNRL